MDSAARVAALRARVVRSSLDAFAVTSPSNVTYITGFDGVFDSEDSHLALISAEGATLYTDTRYETAARRAAEGTEWAVEVVQENLYATVCDALRSDGMARLGVESSVPYGRFKFISEKFSGNVMPCDQWVDEIRQVKDAEEISRIVAAQALTDAAFDYILDRVHVGATERQIALDIEYFMRTNGSDGVAFPPIVASGPNSALPHAKPTDREIQPDEFVKLDFGARVTGYCADMTRTVVVGRASERHRSIYEAVLSANGAGIAGVRGGVTGTAVDSCAREVLAEAGYAEYFGHGLGHGVGIDVHELPRVGPRGTRSILTGSIITIEPGVYMPGFGGVRIEDLVVVEESGATVLTGSTKALLEL